MLDKMMHVCGKQFYNIPMKYFFLQSYHSRLDILHFRCTLYLRLKLKFQCLRMSYCISRCLMLREVFILGINSSLLTDQSTSLFYIKCHTPKKSYGKLSKILERKASKLMPECAKSQKAQSEGGRFHLNIPGNRTIHVD